MWILHASRAGFDADLIVNGSSQMLLAAQVFFGRLYRYMAQEKLNLFDLAPGTMAQSGAGPPEVMRCQFQDSHSFRILLDDMPHNLVISLPHTIPVRQTRRNNLPCDMAEAVSHSSTVPLTQDGTGTVRT
jgi:hypothetical protein